MFLKQCTATVDHSALQNHHFLSENRLDARPALVPAVEKIADYEHKEDSDRLLVLDGDWKFLYIDYKMRGLGSLSCGPEPEEKYELRPHDFRFAFVFTPSTDTDALRQLCDFDFGVHSEALSGAYSVPRDNFEAVREFLDCREKSS